MLSFPRFLRLLGSKFFLPDAIIHIRFNKGFLMSARKIGLLAGITVFSFAVVISLYFYGPSKRIYASSTKVISLQTVDQILQTWKSGGFKGRMAICFTRYLNALGMKDSKEANVTELALHQSILRRITHVPPDNAWQEIDKVLSSRNMMRATPEGYIGVFDDGRVYVMPLSKFSHVEEKSLIIVEPTVWSRDELLQIAEKLRSGKISSDLVIIIRGTEEDAALFRQAVTR
jgi:hypothetical protein